jgi:acetylornithine/N-succinyldiaminopimelate aminotransferase
MSYVLETYARSVKDNFVKGEGCYLYTDKGEKYLDFVQGIAVNALGHNHEYLVKTMKSQADKPWHISNLFLIQEQEKFAKRLCELTKFDSVGFQNSGAEATELAIKAAVKYFYSIRKPEKNKILCINSSFHGRTIATISAGNNPKHTEGFPNLPNFDHFDFGNHEQLKDKITEKTCAILIEPILGESGVKVIPDHCLKGLRELCDEKDILLICDEIQCGYYRSGKFFAHQYANIKPDIVPFAKAVAGGYPSGGCLFVKKVADCMKVGTHGSTFAGSPMAMGLANAVLDVMLEPGFDEHILQVSKYFFDKLNNIQNKFPKIIKEIRGKGLMIGLQFFEEPSKFLKEFYNNKLITVKASDNVIRILPPLNVKKKEIDEGIDIINKTLQEYKS